MPDVPLGDVLSLDRDEVKLEPDVSYTTAGVLNYGRGLFERPAVLGNETKYKSYFRLHRGQFVYSKLFAWEGALTTVTGGFDGMFVSQEFPSFSIDRSRLLPEYMRLITQWPAFWADVRSGEAGMGSRRKRVHPDFLLGLRIPLPDVTQQRRIVDLVAHVDAVVAASRAHHGAGLVAQRSILQDVLETCEAYEPLANVVVKAKAGATPKRDDASNFGGEIPWLKSGEVGQDGISETEESITDDALARSSAWLMPPQSLVVAMYGQGNTAGTVGFTSIAMASNQAVLGLVPDDTKVNPRFLFHWLKFRKPAMRERRVGSTQPNLNKQIVLEEIVPMLPTAEQERIVGVLDVIGETANHSDQLATDAGRTRLALLSSLLTETTTIAEPYDSLMGAV